MAIIRDLTLGKVSQNEVKTENVPLVFSHIISVVGRYNTTGLRISLTALETCRLGHTTNESPHFLVVGTSHYIETKQGGSHIQLET